jgi:uncharacterized protein YcbK (DUF882 family)
MRHLGVAVVAALFSLAGLSIGSEGAAEARSDKRAATASGKTAKKISKKAAKKSAKQSAKQAAKKNAKGKKTAGGKKGRKGKSKFSGHGVAAVSLRSEPVPKPSGDVWLFVENFREEVRVNIYRPDGSFDESALAALDSAFRCKRTGEVRAVDPRLYETLSVSFDQYGGKRIDLVSGFRYQRSEGSRHYHASAADIRIEGVSNRELYKFAESLDVGGMGIGIYPRSGFVHVDYRAPGDPSYRWTDKSGPDSDAPNKQPSRRFKPKS